MKRQGVSISAVDNAVDPVARRLGGLFKGLFSGSPVTMLFSAMGLFKFGSAMVSLTMAAQKAAFSLGTLGLGGKGRVAGRAAVGIAGRAARSLGKCAQGQVSTRAGRFLAHHLKPQCPG